MKPLLYGLLVLLLVRCSPDGPRIADSGTKTGNALTGRCFAADGKPASQARITLFPKTFHPVLKNDTAVLLTAVTDSNGCFEIRGMNPDTYNVEFSDTVSRNRAILQNVCIGGDSTVEITDTLGKSFFVKGQVEQASWLKTIAYSFIRGTRFWASIDSAGQYVFSGVPCGSYDIGVYVDSIIKNWSKGDLDSNNMYLPVLSLTTPKNMIDSYSDTILVKDTIRINIK